MATDPHCGWVLDRLPLLAGGELAGTDRRSVERHLVRCPGCRDRSEALSETLAILHTAGSELPRTAPSPSRPLWPDLERQIRESRRPRPSLVPDWWSLLARPALGLGLAALVALGGMAALRTRPAPDPVVAMPADPPRSGDPGPAVVAREEPPAPPVESAPPPRYEPEPVTAPPAVGREVQNTY